MGSATSRSKSSAATHCSGCTCGKECGKEWTVTISGKSASGFPMTVYLRNTPNTNDLEEELRKEAERLAEEKRLEEKLAEDRRKAEEARRLELERVAEERRRLALALEAERKRREEEAARSKAAQEEAERLERERIAEEQRKAAEEAARKAAEEAARKAAAAAAYTKPLSELQGEEKETMAKMLAQIGGCENGYDWVLQRDGSYQCSGGGHTVTQAQLKDAWLKQHVSK